MTGGLFPRHKFLWLNYAFGFLICGSAGVLSYLPAWCQSQPASVPSPPSPDQPRLSSPAADNIKTLLQQAWNNHLCHNQQTQAVEAAQQALQQDPANYSAHELLNRIYQMQGQSAQRLPHLLAMLQQDQLKNVVYFNDVIYLSTANPPVVWLNLTQRQQLELVLTQRLNIKDGLPPELRTCWQWLLIRLYMENGRIAAARQMIAHLGFVNDWLILGSFDNSQKLGWDEVYPPEKKIDLKRDYDGLRGKIQWRRCQPLTWDGRVDLAQQLQPSEWSTAYALTYVYSPQAQSAMVRAGSDDTLQIWLNDQLILEDENYKGCQPDQHVMSISLAQGWNKILVKVCQGQGAWCFALRFTDLAGQPLTGLRYTVDPQPYSPAASVPQLSPAKQLAGMEAYFLHQLAKQPQAENIRYYLARWLSNQDRRQDALQEYETLLTQNPQCPLYYLEAGQVYLADDQPTKGLKALKKAVALYPQYVEAHLLLGRYYYLNQLHKKAEQEMELVLELFPHQPEARLYLALLHEKKGRLEAAYQQAQLAVLQHPDLSWAQNALGFCAEKKGFYAQAEAAYQKALQAQYTYSVADMNLIQLYLHLGRYADAIQVYQKRQAYEETELDHYFGLVACYRSCQNYQAAQAECQKALALSPQHYRIHTLLGMLALEQGDTAAAKQHWERALQFKPDYLWLREYLKALFPARNLIFEHYGLSEPERQHILQTTILSDQYPKAAGVVLWDQGITQLFQDGSSTHLIHRIIKVLNDPGRERFGQVYLPQSESLEIKRAITIQPNGEEVEPTDIQNNKIAFAAVDRDTIVEYQYTYDESQGGWLEDHFYSGYYFQEQEAPTLHSQWILALPQDKPLNILTQGAKIVSRREQLADNQVYIWEAKQLDQIHAEAFRPPLDEISSWVKVSTLPSWDYVVKWEKSLVKDQLDIDPLLQAKINSLTAASRTSEEKIRALYYFVAREIRYLRREGGWIFGVKPQKAINVFADGYGVCKDKATLLIAMLRAIKIPAYFAIVQSRDQGPQVQAIPYPYFNHVMVYVQPAGTATGFFVDPTGYYWRCGDLPGLVQGVNALVVPASGYQFLRTPVLPAEQEQQSFQEEIQLQADGRAQIKGEQVNTGNYAASHRQRYSVVGRRQELFEEELNRIHPGAELTQFLFEHVEDLDQPLKITYTYRAPAFSRVVGQKLHFTLLNTFNLTDWFAQKSLRFYDLVFYSNWQNVFQQTYRLPPHYQFDQIPADVELRTPWVHYTRKFVCQGSDLLCERSLAFKVIKLPQADYSAFREFCIQVDAEEKKEIVAIPTEK